MGWCKANALTAADTASDASWMKWKKNTSGRNSQQFGATKCERCSSRPHKKAPSSRFYLCREEKRNIWIGCFSRHRTYYGCVRICFSIERDRLAFYWSTLRCLRNSGVRHYIHTRDRHNLDKRSVTHRGSERESPGPINAAKKNGKKLNASYVNTINAIILIQWRPAENMSVV